MCALVRKRVTKAKPLQQVVFTGVPCRWCKRAIWSKTREDAGYCSPVCEQRERTYEFNERRAEQRRIERWSRERVRTARDAQYAASR